MSDTEESRNALRRALAARLCDLGIALELLAEDVLGEEDAAIDWIAAAPDGRTFVVLVAERGDAALLEAGLVQRAWVESRVADWRKLAPSLSLSSELAPHILLLARDFSRTTRIAAREIAGGRITLARFRGDPAAGGVAIERVVPESRVARTAHEPPRRLVSIFRSGLRDVDLAT